MNQNQFGTPGSGGQMKVTNLHESLLSVFWISKYVYRGGFERA
jgi:hypothetical protein